MREKYSLREKLVGHSLREKLVGRLNLGETQPNSLQDSNLIQDKGVQAR